MAITIGEYPGRPYRIPAAQMSEEQSALVESILSGPRKDLPVNMEIWLHSPAFAAVANRFAEYVGHLAPMTRRVKELTILVTATYWDSKFEWHWHSALARKLGFDEQQLRAIAEKKPVTLNDPVEQVVYDFSSATLNQRAIDDKLHGRAVRLLGHAGIADLVGLIGLYSMVAFSLAFYRVPLPSDSSQPG